MFTTPRPDSNTTSVLNLQRLFVLRNIGIAGQALVILIAITWLQLPLPLAPLTLILIALAAWNLFTWWRVKQYEVISDWEFFIQLCVDVLAFSGMLYFSGGATNPLTWVLLLPVIIAATVLPRRFAWGMALLTIVSYSLLMRTYIPLSADDMAHMSHGSDFATHVYGMWFGYIFSASMVAFFVAGMANTLRERDRVLAKAREQALRDEQLVALGTLAAGAAHELGTPLGTMAIVASELENDYPASQDKELHERLGIFREQIARCKQALSIISASAGQVRAESGQQVSVEHYLEGLVEQWRGQRANINLQSHLQGAQPAPNILAEYALTQALTNIFDNAADASPDNVIVNASWDKEKLLIDIKDRGIGLDADTSAVLGKSLYTSKKQGLGLGLFLAHSVIERMGGDVMLFNREGGGVCTRITLPLSKLSITMEDE